jgi:hypothetical protein
MGNGGAEEVRNSRKPRLPELLQLLNEFEVRYSDGYAVMKYAEPRYMKDLDLWVENSPENSLGVFQSTEKIWRPARI